MSGFERQLVQQLECLDDDLQVLKLISDLRSQDSVWSDTVLPLPLLAATTFVLMSFASYSSRPAWTVSSENNNQHQLSVNVLLHTTSTCCGLVAVVFMTRTTNPANSIPRSIPGI